MFPVTKTEFAGASGTALPRPVAGGRVSAAADDRPYLAYGPLEPSDSETAAKRLLGDKDEDAEKKERQTPASFFGPLETPSEAFAAALSVKRLDETEEEPRFDFFRGPRPFSGLLVRAVSLYEATSSFLRDAPQRGDALNAIS